MTDKTQEALKLALEALKSCNAGDYSTGHVIHPSFDEDAVNKAIEAIDALAELAAQQEPVAWANPNDLQNFDMKVRTNGGPLHTVPLYTSPQPSKPWAGLTPEDFTGMDVSNAFEAGAWWADVTLQEKNNG